jgi:hypothetical protein
MFRGCAEVYDGAYAVIYQGGLTIRREVVEVISADEGLPASLTAVGSRVASNVASVEAAVPFQIAAR